MGRDNQIYVMDTGNSRIKVLDADLVFSHHITCPQLEGRSVTGERWREMVRSTGVSSAGLCLGLNNQTLVSVNWRTKVVAEMTLTGRQLGSFSHPELVEPIAVSVSPRGQFVVVDSGLGICLFDQCGKLIRQISEPVSRLSSLQQTGPLSLVQLLHYCALIGRELKSVEIFSCTERSYYRRPNP